MSDVFVSYARVDQARVRRYVDRLRASGFSVKWDEDLRGQPFDSQIKRWIEKASVVVAFWSSTSVRREFVLGELNHADIQKIINVRIDPIASDLIPLRLNCLDIIDLSTSDVASDSDGVLKLIARCAEICGVEASQTSEPPEPKAGVSEAVRQQAGVSISVGTNNGTVANEIHNHGVIANTIHGSLKTGR